MIENIPVVMVHDHLSDQRSEIASYSEYSFRNYQTGDAGVWSTLQAMTDSFASQKEALLYFYREFGKQKMELSQRCFFLETDQGTSIGTAMAWLGDAPFGATFGRLHWVVIHPDFRGKGLGKYLIKYTLQQLSQLYSKAYLTTQTTSYPAIKIYLDFGFRPFIADDESVRAWKLLKEILMHPAL